MRTSRFTDGQIMAILGEGEAGLPAELLDRHARFGLPEDANDLFLGKSALLHVRHFPG